MTEYKPIDIGSIARVTKEHETSEGWAYAGTLFRVEGRYPAVAEHFLKEEYFGYSLDGLSAVSADSEYVELAMTPEEAAARRAPTKEEIAKALSSAVMRIWDDNGFRVHTAYAPLGGEIEFEGSTDDGVEFGFTVKVLEVEEVEF